MLEFIMAAGANGGRSAKRFLFQEELGSETACSSASGVNEWADGERGSKRACLDSILNRDRGPAPFTRELPLPRRREVPISYEEALRGTTEPVRVLADGIFDLFHLGHSHCLLQAKRVFPNTHLIVGVNSQKMTASRKGKTVCNEVERYDAVRHCRYVDEVLTDSPWVMTLQFMDRYRIDFVAHDESMYPFGDVEDIYRPIKESGRFVSIKRNTGVSTSGIVARIVRDYDMYLKRNLDRGYSAKELNVGFMKAREVELRETVRKGRDMLTGFMSLFGWNGKLSGYFRGQPTHGAVLECSGSAGADETVREADEEGSEDWPEQEEGEELEEEGTTEEGTMEKIQALYSVLD